MAISFDLLTGLAVSGIAAILAIYVVVVYKKGWLRRESKTDQAYYLCPSQKCRRVFKKPVWLTDLLQSPPESYQACPHCGIKIQVASPSSLATAMSEVGVKSPAISSEDRRPQDGLHFTKRETTMGEPEPKREPKPTLLKGGFAGQPVSDDERMPKPSAEFPQMRKEPQQKPLESPGRGMENSSVEKQRKCSHFFGYVKTLPRNTPIPDECLWCPSIVDCLSHKQKVEAEA